MTSLTQNQILETFQQGPEGHIWLVSQWLTSLPRTEKIRTLKKCQNSKHGLDLVELSRMPGVRPLGCKKLQNPIIPEKPDNQYMKFLMSLKTPVPSQGMASPQVDKICQLLPTLLQKFSAGLTLSRLEDAVRREYGIDLAKVSHDLGHKDLSSFLLQIPHITISTRARGARILVKYQKGEHIFIHPVNSPWPPIYEVGESKILDGLQIYMIIPWPSRCVGCGVGQREPVKTSCTMGIW
uniref:Uncharacterized protein LOC117367496 isoform X2 n=1 Tax=Geotrypetes seraphini TaxID=260995 RepID=A0A6P8SCQ3_GEOSA|nr:uncharacterized protein LOC117367496 isoform X2 [Geotrypetes seraphini]